MTQTNHTACFAGIPFADAEGAARRLESVLRHGVHGFSKGLASSLRKASNPDRELTGLDRYLDACGTAAEDEVRHMAAEAGYVRMLGILLSQSTFLTDIVCRHPEFVRWLWDTAPLDRARTRAEMMADILEADEEAGCDFDVCCKAMRCFRKREILRIAVREMDRHAPMESVTKDLSNLADAAIETAIRCAWHTIEARFGKPEDGPEGRPAAFTVLAMGKLGGRELNFSSDIDLLFFYSNEGKTAGGGGPGMPRRRSISNGEFFCKLGEWVIKALTDATADGFLFRVDMRLRPHGRDGTLAVTVDSAVDYYVNYGRAWERQALIKARPCAGD